MRRIVCTVLVAAIAWCLSGCRSPKESDLPVWDKVKIGDLAPSDANGQGLFPLQVTSFDIHVFELPAERIKALRSMWDSLSITALRFRNHTAFRANAFRAAKGTTYQLDGVISGLTAAGAHKLSKSSLLLSEDQESDLHVSDLPQPSPVTFVAKDGSTQQLTLGPGRLVLRMKPQRVTGSPGIRQLVAYPVFTPFAAHSIPALAQKAKENEVAFVTAAFTASVQMGEMLVLGPEDYYEGPSTLGGLFFCSPGTVLRFQRPSARGPIPSVQVFVIVCTAIPDDVQ